MITKIPGYRRASKDNDKNRNYLLRIKRIDGIVLNKKNLDGKDLSAQLQMTFMYRNMDEDQRFFFGRTAKTKKSELKPEKGGKSYMIDQVELMYFHSSLEKILSENQNKSTGSKSNMEIFLVFELIISAEDRRQKGDIQVLSGGYGTCKIFDFNSKQQEEKLQLQSGSPRDLLALVHSKMNQCETKLTLILTRDFDRFDVYKQLIPDSCIINEKDKVPGIYSEPFKSIDKDKPYKDLPEQKDASRKDKDDYDQRKSVPKVKDEKYYKDLAAKKDGTYKEDPKKEQDKKEQKDYKSFVEPAKLIKPTQVYIHNIEILGSAKVEDQIRDTIAKMHCDQKMDSQGKTDDFRDIDVRVESRRINVKVHNTFQQICSQTYSTLQRANDKGVFSGDASLSIKDYLPDQLCALIFELEFHIQVGQSEPKLVCLGFTYEITDPNTLGGIKPKDICAKLQKGPGETLMNTMLFSETVTDDNICLFEFALLAQISGDKNPESEQLQKKRRFTSMKSLKEEEGFQAEVKPATDTRSRRDDDRRRSTERRRETDDYDRRRDGSPSRYKKDDDYGYSKDPYYDRHRKDDYGYDQDRNRDRDRRSRSPASRDRRERVLSPFRRDEGYKFDDRDDYEGYRKDGQISREEEEMYELLNTQKKEMSAEMQRMREFMQGYLQDMSGLQEKDRRKAQSMGGRDARGDYDDQVGPNNDNMRQISNVLCNLLGMIGAQRHDERIVGLAEDLKQQVQSKRFESLLDQNVPYAGFEGVNLLRVSDLSQRDRAHLEKNGMGGVLRQPSASVLSSSIIKNKLNLDIESKDELKASTIKVKFVAFKTPLGKLGQVPKKFFFKLRFFTFPPVETDSLRLKVDHDPSGAFVTLQPGTPYLLEKLLSAHAFQASHQPGLEISFDVDPSASKIENEHVKLAEYLKERFLSIDIFDVTTKFFYGSCKLPLFELLRQGKQYVVRPKECEVFDPESSTYKGFLQVVLSNEGKPPSVTDHRGKLPAGTKVGKQPSQGAHHNSKKIMSRPMDLICAEQAQLLGGGNTMQSTGQSFGDTSKSNGHNQTIINLMNEMAHQEKIQTENNAERNAFEDRFKKGLEGAADLRKKLRVHRIKQLTSAGESAGQPTSIMNDPKQPDWAKQNYIQKIDLIRQAKKHRIVEQVMGNHLSDAKQIYIIPGEFSFLEIPLENNTDSRQVYQAVIHDPDFDGHMDGSRLLEQPEVEMVSGARELQYWIDLGKCAQTNVQCLQDQGTVLLEAGEKMNAVVKFTTKREVSHDLHQEASPDIIKQRSIRISFNCTNQNYKNYQGKESKQVELVVDVNLIPLFPPIDHVFRYYEPENSYFKVKIPPFMQIPQGDIAYDTSRVTAQINLTKNQGFEVSSKTGEAMKVVDLTIFVWSGPYRSNLLATIKVEVTPLSCIYSQTRAGVQNTLSLALPVQSARQIEVHSSKPANVYLPERTIMNKFTVIPNSIHYIQLQTKTYNEQEQRVVVNAVECDPYGDKSNLIYSWLIILASQAPYPTQTLSRFTANPNTMTPGKVLFENRTRKDLVFEIASSREDILVPTEKVMKFSAGQKSDIEFVVHPPHGQSGTLPVYLFVGDSDQYVMECIEIKLDFRC